MMPFPKISTLLNNSLLHALTPEIYQQIQAIACSTHVAFKDPKILGCYEELKATFVDYYKIPSDNFTWLQWYYLLSAYNALDIQLILGPVLRLFMRKVMEDLSDLTLDVAKQLDMSAEFLIRQTTSLQFDGRYQPLSLSLLSDFLATPLGLALYVLQSEELSGFVRAIPWQCALVPLIPQGLCIREGVLDTYSTVANWEKSLDSKKIIDVSHSRFGPIVYLLEKNQQFLVKTGLKLIGQQVNKDLKLRFNQRLTSPKLERLHVSIMQILVYTYEREFLSPTQAEAALGQGVTLETKQFMQQSEFLQSFSELSRTKQVGQKKALVFTKLFMPDLLENAEGYALYLEEVQALSLHEAYQAGAELTNISQQRYYKEIVTFLRDWNVYSLENDLALGELHLEQLEWWLVILQYLGRSHAVPGTLVGIEVLLSKMFENIALNALINGVKALFPVSLENYVKILLLSTAEFEYVLELFDRLIVWQKENINLGNRQDLLDTVISSKVLKALLNEESKSASLIDAKQFFTLLASHATKSVREIGQALPLMKIKPVTEVKPEISAIAEVAQGLPKAFLNQTPASALGLADKQWNAGIAKAGKLRGAGASESKVEKRRPIINPSISTPPSLPALDVSTTLPTSRGLSAQLVLADKPQEVKAKEFPKNTKKPLAKPKLLPSIIEEEPQLHASTLLSLEETQKLQARDALRQECLQALEVANIRLTKNQSALIKSSAMLQKAVLLLHTNNLLSENNLELMWSQDRFVSMVIVLSEHQLLQQSILSLLQSNFHDDLLIQLNQLAEAKVLFPASLEFVCKNTGEHFSTSTVIILLAKLYTKPLAGWRAILEECKTALPGLRWLIYLSHCNLFEPAIFKAIQNQAYFPEFSVDKTEKLILTLAGVTTKLINNDYSLFCWWIAYQYTTISKKIYHLFYLQPSVIDDYLERLQANLSKLTRLSLVDWIKKDASGENFKCILLAVNWTVIPYRPEPFLLIDDKQLLPGLRDHVRALFPYVEFICSGKNSKNADKIIGKTKDYLSQLVGEQCHDLNKFFSKEPEVTFTEADLRLLIKDQSLFQDIATVNFKNIDGQHLRQKLLELRLHPMLMFELITMLQTIAFLEKNSIGSFAEVLILPDVYNVLNAALIEKLLDHKKYDSLLTLLQANREPLTAESFSRLLDLSKEVDHEIPSLASAGLKAEKQLLGTPLDMNLGNSRQGMLKGRELVLSRGQYTIVDKNSTTYSSLKLSQIDGGIVIILNSRKYLAAGHLGTEFVDKNLNMLQSMIEALQISDNGSLQAELIGGYFGNPFVNSLKINKLMVKALDLASIPCKFEKWHSEWTLMCLLVGFLMVALAQLLESNHGELIAMCLVALIVANGIFTALVAREYTTTVEISTGKISTAYNMYPRDHKRFWRDRSNWSPTFISSSHSSQQGLTLEQTEATPGRRT